MPLIGKAFKRLHYPIDVIGQCVRWYLVYALSLRNPEEMMAEHGVIITLTVLNRPGKPVRFTVSGPFQLFIKPCWYSFIEVEIAAFPLRLR